jgi:hypothetical protein
MRTCNGIRSLDCHCPKLLVKLRPNNMCARYSAAKDLAEFAKFFNFVCRVAFFAPRLAPSRPLSRPHGLCRSQILFATSQVVQIKQRPAPASPVIYKLPTTAKITF